MGQGEPSSSLLRRLSMTLGPSGRLLRAHGKAFTTWISSRRGRTLSITDVLDGHRVVRNDVRPLTYCGISVASAAIFADAPSGPFSYRDLMFREAAAGRLTG